MLELFVAAHKEFDALRREEVGVATEKVQHFEDFQSALELTLLSQVLVLAAKLPFVKYAELFLEKGLHELVDCGARDVVYRFAFGPLSPQSELNDAVLALLLDVVGLVLDGEVDGDLVSTLQGRKDGAQA